MRDQLAPMATGRLPTGTKGFDANVSIGAQSAERFYNAGYRFVVRYVPRVRPQPHDLSVGELAALLRAGLAVMVVQHVALPGWHPTADLGDMYGAYAAEAAEEAGYAMGAVLWCDLEEVAAGTPREETIAYCNAWYEAVRAVGYRPGLYVGYGCGLNAHDLYYRLKFSRYWSAYNLNKDQYPAVRGVQLRQFVAKAADRVPGVEFQFDVNLIGKDSKGSTPLLMLAPGDR